MSKNSYGSWTVQNHPFALDLESRSRFQCQHFFETIQKPELCHSNTTHVFYKFYLIQNLSFITFSKNAWVKSQNFSRKQKSHISVLRWMKWMSWVFRNSKHWLVHHLCTKLWVLTFLFQKLIQFFLSLNWGQGDHVSVLSWILQHYYS